MSANERFDCILIELGIQTCVLHVTDINSTAKGIAISLGDEVSALQENNYIYHHNKFQRCTEMNSVFCFLHGTKYHSTQSPDSHQVGERDLHPPAI